MSTKKPASSRHCKLTPEGWVYVVIICFIAIGAILRNVNLLILATGMLLAPLVYNWRVCVANLRTLSARRVIPERIHAQTPVNVSWTCNNIGGRLTARNLMLHDCLSGQSESVGSQGGVLGLAVQKISNRIESVFQNGNLGKEYAHVCFQSVTSLAPSVSVYQCFFPGRGEFTFGPAEMRSSFPFGLVTSCIPLGLEETIYVAPPLGVLHPTWEQRINSMETGDQSRMRRRGIEEDEFYALRKWRSGDSEKNIHWRSTARHGYPMVKQYDQPNDRDFALLLDLHTEDEVTRLQCEKILSFAATAVSQVAADVQGQLAVAVCGDENQLVAGRQNRATHANVMRRLAIATPTSMPEMESALIELASVISAGTPLYCFSTRERPATLNSHDSSPALKAVCNLVRWIRVDTPEFAELFSIDTGSKATRSNDSRTDESELVAAGVSE